MTSRPMRLYCAVRREAGGIRIGRTIEATDALEAVLCVQARYGVSWGILPHRAAMALVLQRDAARNDLFCRRANDV
jgi:hypothetical protein